MTPIKYTQETVNDIENFFQSQFNKTSVGKVKSGTREGQLFLSYRELSKSEANTLHEFSMNTMGMPFKNVQTAINKRVTRGELTLDFNREQEAETKSVPTKNVVTTMNIIVKCSRLVRDNKMSSEELCEIIENLYP